MLVVRLTESCVGAADGATVVAIVGAAGAAAEVTDGCCDVVQLSVASTLAGAP